MKKQFLIGLCAMMLCIANIPATSVLATEVSVVGCGDWETVNIGDSFCDTEDGCGLLWLKDTNKAYYWVKRTCLLSNNDQYEETQRQETKLGCCQ